MSDMFSCHDKDSLIAYLYDEVDAPLRRQIEEHRRSCRACSDEVESLTAVRAELSAWTPPETELGLTIAKRSGCAPDPLVV
ncbi:MAG: anti-sigma factor family protein [Vicinamibacterales bacterium]